MGRSFVVTRSRVNISGRKKKTLNRSIVIGPTAIRFISMTIVAVLAIVYLSQSTAGASRGVKVRDLQASKDSLTLEQERLETEQTRLRALKEVEAKSATSGMETVTSVQHLSGGN